MLIDISDVLRNEGYSLELAFEEKLENIDLKHDIIAFDRPVSFTGSLINTGNVLQLTGKLQTLYTAVCYKCTGDVKVEMEIPIAESFVDSKHAEDDPEDVYEYQDHFIETADIFRDNIILNMPMRYECSAECKGLCPSCGTNLNIQKCECVIQEYNPAMEKLKALLKDE